MGVSGKKMYDNLQLFTILERESDKFIRIILVQIRRGYLEPRRVLQGTDRRMVVGSAYFHVAAGDSGPPSLLVPTNAAVRGNWENL